ncbi:hypothetical protein C8J56DRAFT_780848 [Mycena floridula]|nr:hypothetical protein C8J56DRAFT_780848 [Mycena floridula]
MYVTVLFKIGLILICKYFRETPPTTPQRQRNIEHQNERDNRVMNTPQHRQLPQPVPNIEITPQGSRSEDPFMDVDADGQALRLSQGIDSAVQALPPLPVIRTRT